ncbi:MAG: 4-hydroxy-tetrahydrodipicolinate reductase [Phycisphaerae bacterium]|nr:4-hydroxy-tetrahydrodipicolinate reductase [Phycisphaerae bacterium]
MKYSLIVNGAAGRMGKRIMAFACEDGFFSISAAIEHPKHPDLGKNIGQLAGIEALNVALQSQLPSAGDVMIDFSLPEAADASIRHCADNNIALVLGTTGLSAAQFELLRQAAGKIAIVQATNMSLGMNLLFSLVGKVAKSLGAEYDIEIIEAHHRFKKDAPSGSALSLAEAICKETGRSYPGGLVHGREGKDVPRQAGEIGMHAVRAGDIIGQHTVLYSSLGESVTIAHNAHTRDTFARGALRAAKWVVEQKPGLYSMKDVLGLQ